MNRLAPKVSLNRNIITFNKNVFQCCQSNRHSKQIHTLSLFLPECNIVELIYLGFTFTWEDLDAYITDELVGITFVT